MKSVFLKIERVKRTWFTRHKVRSGWDDHGRRQLCKCNGNKDKRNQLFGSPKMIPLLFFVLDPQSGISLINKYKVLFVLKYSFSHVSNWLKNGVIYNSALQAKYIF